MCVCLVAQSYLTLWDPVDCSPPGSLVHGDSPGKNTRVSCHALLQGIFPTQESNPGLLHYRWILYCLSYQESPRILEWVAYPFSMGSSWPRNWTWVSHIAGRFFTIWATKEALLGLYAPLFFFIILITDLVLHYTFIYFLFCLLYEELNSVLFSCMPPFKSERVPHTQCYAMLNHFSRVRLCATP